MAFKREKALAAAQKYTAKGQHEKAVREYQSIVDNAPKDLRAWLMLADALVRAKQPEEAIKRYTPVAKAYHEQKAYSKALAVYRQILKLDPRRIDVHLKCAALHVELRQMHDGVAIYEKVAKVYLKQARNHDAIELFKKVADLDEKSVTRRLRLAELYSRETMNDEAVAAFRLAGELLLKDAKHEEYSRVAERLLYHKADDRDTILKLVRAYIKLRQPRRALVKLNALLQADAADVEGLELLCETFVRLGKVDKAVSVALEIVREHAKGPDGQELAKRILDRALEWAPNDAELQSARAALGSGPKDEPAPAPPVKAEVAAPAQIDAGQSIELAEFDDDFEDDFGDIDSDLEDAELEAKGGAAPAAARKAASGDAVEELEEFEEIEEFDELDDSEALELVEEDEDEFADAELEDSKLTRRVMSGVEQRGSAAESDEVDLDRQLQEARVLRKYRLYDNALVHLDAILGADPRHLAALQLRADLLGDRKDLSGQADALVALADVLSGTDPSRASASLRAALAAVPGHAAAQKALRELGPDTTTAPAPSATPPPPPSSHAADDFGLIETEDEDTSVYEVAEGGDTDDSGDFAISIDDDADEEEEEEVDYAVEDRFGLPEESVELPLGGIRDISSEIETIEGLLGDGRESEARMSFLALERENPDHPALASLSERFAPVEEDSGAAAAPLLDLDDDDVEDDDYLADIFSDDDDDGTTAEPVASAASQTEMRGRAQVADGEADAATQYDLGTAYHGMGLVDDALRELNQAAEDPEWRARALTMVSRIESERGDLDAAASAAERAVEASRNADERSDASYLLGDALLATGDRAGAKAAFEGCAPGFRDREARLAQL